MINFVGFVIFLFAATLFAQNFTISETEIYTNLSKNYSYSEEQDEYFSITPITSKGKNRYFICECVNLEIPYADGLKILLDYPNYSDRFRYILRSENTNDNNYFFILGIPFAKTWLWGSVGENLGENSSQISFVQTKSAINYSDSVKSLIVIDFDKLVLQWNLTKIDRYNSRFCLTGAAEPQKPVPQWLVKVALKKVIPRTLKNLKDKQTER